MKPINKTIRVGNCIFCKIQFDGTKLSISGVKNPRKKGDADSCGQIIMNEWGIETYAPGWSKDLETQFRAVWNQWHLNDMQAGTPSQTAYLRANPVHAVYPDSHYTKTCEALTAAGLNPDNGYKYGSRWLFVEVPEDVITFLDSLPVTDIAPAWI
jgi:hypothetical protein